MQNRGNIRSFTVNAPGPRVRARRRSDSLARLSGGRDQRDFVRAAMPARVRWQSSSGSGEAVLLDVSPNGAALGVPRSDLPRLRGLIRLDVELMPGVQWKLADRARVVTRAPQGDTKWRVGVLFLSEGKGIGSL